MFTFGLVRGEFPKVGEELFDLGEGDKLLLRGDEEIRDRGDVVADLLAELRFVTPGSERLGLV